jgi:Cytochrome c
MRSRLVTVFLILGLAACEGPVGPEGPMGSPGTNGTAGQQGPPGAGLTVPAGYTAADGILGGAAYSKWWTTDAGGTGSVTTAVKSDFYRCKACHAWDGLGNAASYATRTGQSTLKTTRPDVSGVNLRSTAASESYQELYDLIARAGARGIDASDNTHPDYSTNLTTGQIWNIVKFMREEWVVPSDLYDIEVKGPAMYVDYSQNPPVVVSPTITYSNIGAKGDAGPGGDVYDGSCASCHGADGTEIDIEGRSLGQLIREKPNEAWFKVKFGEAGKMDPGLVTSLSALQNLYAALVVVADFPNPN